MRADLPYWLALHRFQKFGAIRLKKLADFFPSMEEAFFAPLNQLIEAEIAPTVADKFIRERGHIDPNQELQLINFHHVNVTTILDDDYPEDLKTIHDPPAILFYKGTLPNHSLPHLAVVGSRHPTNYGKKVTEDLVKTLAQNGVVIVSGLAYGIDSIAHEATLSAHGQTIAVLGTGIDQDSIYPSRHRDLASRIVANNSAIISEFPIGTHVFKSNFPVRNRIIAGLCKATLVTEATEKSGSLITARASLESGRDVYAVPGPIHSELSTGPNNLIKIGAKTVTSAEDIINELGLVMSESTKPKPKPASAEEAQILEVLTQEPLHVNEIIQKTELPTSKATSTLTLMEMKGSARHMGGLYYVKG